MLDFTDELQFDLNYKVFVQNIFAFEVNSTN